jgi:hypothetical protein
MCYSGSGCTYFCFRHIPESRGCLPTGQAGCCLSLTDSLNPLAKMTQACRANYFASGCTKNLNTNLTWMLGWIANHLPKLVIYDMLSPVRESQSPSSRAVLSGLQNHSKPRE